MRISMFKGPEAGQKGHKGRTLKEKKGTPQAEDGQWPVKRGESPQHMPAGLCSTTGHYGRQEIEIPHASYIQTALQHWHHYHACQQQKRTSNPQWVSAACIKSTSAAYT